MSKKKHNAIMAEFVNRLGDDRNRLEQENARLKAQLKLAVEALEHYADPSWKHFGIRKHFGDLESRDLTGVAKETLAKIKEGVA